MKKYFIILGSLQAFTAIGAIPAGIGFLLDITGEGMGLSTEALANSPLDSFLLPGLFLLIVIGLANASGAWLSFTVNRFAGHAGLILGGVLCLWIVIQVVWLTLSSFMQPLFLAIGLADIFLGRKILQK